MHIKNEEVYQKTEFLITTQNFVGLRKYFIEIYSKLKCDCFFKGQNSSTKQRLLKLIENYQDLPELIDPGEAFFLNYNAYDLDFEKGIIYLWNHRQEKAYTYLTKAIKSDCQNDLYYYLRSTIDHKINPYYLEDAKWAVLINPSSLNYSALINALSKEKKWNDRFIEQFIDKVIEYEPFCECIYLKKGKLHEDRQEYASAVICYKKVVFFNHLNFEIKQRLAFLLNNTSNYQLSNGYAKSILEAKPNEYELYFLLARNYGAMGYGNEYLKYLIKYLKSAKENNLKSDNLKSAISSLNFFCINNAKRSYEQNRYTDVINYIELSNQFDEIKIYHKLYFYSILLIHNKTIIIGKDNIHYTKLSEFKETWNYGSDDSAFKNNRDFIKEYSTSDVLRFGKYSGKDINNILTEDPNYLIILILKNNHFAVSNDVFLNEQIKKSPDYYRALEINIIKEKFIDDNNLDGRWDDVYEDERRYSSDMLREMQGDWGGLNGDEAEIGYWNTE